MKDPVCGMEVTPPAAGSSVYHGQTHYFCSKGCKAAFDADPARYTDGHGGHESHRQGATGPGRD